MNAGMRKISTFRLDQWFLIGILTLSFLVILPEFFHFKAKTRVLETKANLSLIRERIELFKRHHGRHPTSLDELLAARYSGRMHAETPYLEELPPEKLSKMSGIRSFHNIHARDVLMRPGGWAYRVDLGRVYVNAEKKLDGKWGSYSGEVPSQW